MVLSHTRGCAHVGQPRFENIMADPVTKEVTTLYFFKAELDSSCGNSLADLAEPPPYNGRYRDFVLDDSDIEKLKCFYGRSEVNGTIPREDMDNASKLAVIRLISIRTVRGLPWSLQRARGACNRLHTAGKLSATRIAVSTGLQVLDVARSRCIPLLRPCPLAALVHWLKRFLWCWRLPMSVGLCVPLMPVPSPSYVRRPRGGAAGRCTWFDPWSPPRARRGPWSCAPPWPSWPLRPPPGSAWSRSWTARR